MAYVNDSKPSGTSTDDIKGTRSIYGTAKYGTAKYGDAGSYAYTKDSKPSGSYANDTKPS